MGFTTQVRLAQNKMEHSLIKYVRWLEPCGRRSLPSELTQVIQGRRFVYDLCKLFSSFKNRFWTSILTIRNDQLKMTPPSRKPLESFKYKHSRCI